MSSAPAPLSPGYSDEGCWALGFQPCVVQSLKHRDVTTDQKGTVRLGLALKVQSALLETKLQFFSLNSHLLFLVCSSARCRV